MTLVCRDRQRGERALAEVSAAHPGATARLEIADLASLDSVRELGRRLRQRLARIDILVNNAAVWRNRLEHSGDGFERTLATNHLGHFLLTHLLLERLRDGAQIVNVSSEAHRSADLRRAPLEEIVRGRAWQGGFQAYADSKLANLLFTLEAVRRWEGAGIAVNALHPGALATRIWNQNSGVVGLLLRILKLFLRKPEVGGEAVLHLVQRALEERTSGHYFRVRGESTPSAQGRDLELAGELWEQTAAWTGIA